MFFSLLKSKKGQLQLMESTIALFVFFLMVMAGMAIYTNYQKSRLSQVQYDIDQQKATSIAKKIMFTPEIRCSNNNAGPSDCFEIQRLRAFRDTVSDNALYYREIFGSSKVVVRWVYGPSFTGTFLAPDFFATNNSMVINEPEQPLFDFSIDSTSKNTFYFPVTLWDKRIVPENSYFGWLIVEVYS